MGVGECGHRLCILYVIFHFINGFNIVILHNKVCCLKPNHTSIYQPRYYVYGDRRWIIRHCVIKTYSLSGMGKRQINRRLKILWPRTPIIWMNVSGGQRQGGGHRPLEISELYKLISQNFQWKKLSILSE